MKSLCEHYTSHLGKCFFSISKFLNGIETVNDQALVHFSLNLNLKVLNVGEHLQVVYTIFKLNYVKPKETNSYFTYVSHFEGWIGFSCSRERRMINWFTHHLSLLNSSLTHPSDEIMSYGSSLPQNLSVLSFADEL